MQTTHSSSVSATPQARGTCSAKLRHPPLPDTYSRIFWLSTWMSEQAESEAYRAYVAFPTRRLPKNIVLSTAMFAADRLLREQARKSLENVRQDGLLLCAWAGTTIVPA